MVHTNPPDAPVIRATLPRTSLATGFGPDMTVKRNLTPSASNPNNRSYNSSSVFWSTDSLCSIQPMLEPVQTRDRYKAEKPKGRMEGKMPPNLPSFGLKVLIPPRRGDDINVNKEDATKGEQKIPSTLGRHEYQRSC